MTEEKQMASGYHVAWQRKDIEQERWFLYDGWIFSTVQDAEAFIETEKTDSDNCRYKITFIETKFF